MSAEPGLRERKKQQTHQAIAEAAQQLFAERGFDAVTVAEVARAADVSEGTVFNYFPTKEDLFYSGMQVFEAELVEAVRNRGAGESVLQAVRSFLRERAARSSPPTCGRRASARSRGSSEGSATTTSSDPVYAPSRRRAASSASPMRASTSTAATFSATCAGCVAPKRTLATRGLASG